MAGGRRNRTTSHRLHIVNFQRLSMQAAFSSTTNSFALLLQVATILAATVSCEQRSAVCAQRHWWLRSSASATSLLSLEMRRTRSCMRDSHGDGSYAGFIMSQRSPNCLQLCLSQTGVFGLSGLPQTCSTPSCALWVLEFSLLAAFSSIHRRALGRSLDDASLPKTSECLHSPVRSPTLHPPR